MPVSNGQITGRDIRQTAIRESHLRGSIISTGKLVDLAVTIDKLEDNTWATAFESAPFVNPTLTTTATEQTFEVIDVPAWVGQVSVFAIGNCQMTNSSGGDQQLNVSVRVNDADDGARSVTVVDGDVGQCWHVEAADLLVPGTSFEVSIYVWVSSGTNSANNGAVFGMVLGTR